MYDTVMVRTDDHLVTRVIVQAVHKVIDMMCFRDMRSEFLTYQLAAYLAAIAREQLQVFAD